MALAAAWWAVASATALSLLAMGCDGGEDRGGTAPKPPGRGIADRQLTEVRYLSADVLADGKTVRVALAESGGLRPYDALVEMGSEEVILTVRLAGGPDVTADLVGKCVEMTLPEPIRERRLVDGGPGPFNPYSASVPAIERMIRAGTVPCARVPVVGATATIEFRDER